MFFDLLYALVGYTGNVIVRKENTFNSKRTRERISFQLASDFPYISTAERRAIDRISNIGALYTIVDEFACGSGFSLHSKKSLYLLALQKAVDEILDEYRQLIASYEEEAIHRRLQNLSLVEGELRVWERRFEDLCMFFDKILENKRQNGPELITLLIKFCTSGSPDTASLCMRLLKKCIKVLLIQLQTWLYYGELQDPHEEFFLKKKSKDAVEQNEHSSLSLAEDIVIAEENLTPLFSHVMVKDILFIGGVVKALRNSESDSSQVDWNELEAQIDNLRSLETQPLRSLLLESNIQLTRQWASKQLMRFLFRLAWWKEFEFLRQSFLLGKGDLWSHFLHDTCDVLTIPPVNVSKESALNTFLEKSLLKVFFEVDFRYEILRFERMNFLASNSETTTNLLPLSSGWSQIRLSYVPRNPLHILMTTKDLEHYSRVFCIVFAITHVRFQMEHCWLIFRNAFKECNRTALVKNRNMFQLLRRCSFLVRSLEEFYQIDLIEESFGSFMKQAKAASDFDSVHLLHQKYINTLAKHTLIYSSSFIESLDNLLQVFREYCTYIQHKWVQDKATQMLLSIERIQQPINERITAFLQELQKYPNHPISNRLLKRMDFNNFYSLEKGTSLDLEENVTTCIEEDQSDNE